MEAAKGVMNTLAKLGQQSAEAKLAQLVAGHFLARGATLQALQLTADPLAQARQLPEQASVAATLPALPSDLASLPETAASLESIAELSQTASKQLAEDDKLGEALQTVEALSSAFCALGDKASEAAALSALSSACSALGGEPRDAARAAAGAVRAARALGSKPALISALESAISTSFAQKDPDEALRAATELAKLASENGDRKLEAKAKLATARAQLANEEPRLGMEASFEAVELFKGLGDKAGQAAALSVAYDIEVLLGKPLGASARAREVLALVKGDKKAEASANLMVGSVDTASQDALNACREATTLFRSLGDRAGEGAALVATANAQLCQDGKLSDEGLQSAREALAVFKELKSRPGEAAALAAAGAAHTQKGEAAEAEKAIREALALFHELQNSVGEAFATGLLKSAKAAAAKPSDAKVTVDEATSLAHIELTDNVSLASLQEAITTLQNAKGVSCVVLLLEGAPLSEAGPAPGTSGSTQAARAFGMFIMGLRMLGLPVICAIWGKISGPAWSLVLTSDYRVAATSTVFMCPIWGKPECMGDLVGHNTATQLCMANGPRDSLVMLETGVLHQLQKGKEDTRKAAVELAKRVASTPAMACRKQPFMHTQCVEEYALAAATGKVA